MINRIYNLIQNMRSSSKSKEPKAGLCKRGKPVSVSILLVMILILVGCQSQKDLLLTQEEIRVTIQSTQQQAPEQGELSSSTEGEEALPDHIEEDILTSERYGRVYINAGVNAELFSATFTQRIFPDKITQSDVDFMLEHFFQNAVLSNSDPEITKAQIESDMKEISSALANPEDLTQDDIAGMEAALQTLKIQLSGAPNEETASPGSTLLAIHPESKNEALYITADLGRKTRSTLDIVNFLDNSNISFLILYLDHNKVFLSSTELTGKDAAGQVMTLQEANRKALVYQQELNLSNLVLFDVQPGMTEDQLSQGYIAIFRQGIAGHAIAKPEVLDLSGDRPNLGDQWPSDELRVKFDDSGITAIEWNNKGSLAGMPEPVETIPFSFIIEVAKKELANKYAWNENVQYPVDVHVDRIALEYVVAPQEGENASFAIIPAWNFYGNVLCKYEDGTSEEFYGARTDICHVSISAIDGSILS